MTYENLVHCVTLVCVFHVVVPGGTRELAARLKETGTRSDVKSYDLNSNRLPFFLRMDWTLLPKKKEIDRLLEGYDPQVPPNFEDDIPTTVLVQTRITSIDTISESDMGIITHLNATPTDTLHELSAKPTLRLLIKSLVNAVCVLKRDRAQIRKESYCSNNRYTSFSVGMFLRQTWNDSRLSYEPLPNIRFLELDTRLMDQVWVPDLFITNEKEASFHIVTVPNKLMHVFPEGRIQYSVRITATLKCDMDLRKYPLDSQTCDIVFESYGYSTENLIFDWNDPPFILPEGLRLPQFSLEKMHTARCDKQYVGVNYTCINLEFDILRRYGYYLTQVYIPSILIVILSWVSFWLDIDAIPARISLGVLTVLTMTTQSSGARTELPKVSYVKAIDVWMAMCLVFVFLALLQFAYVNVLSRVQRRRESVRPQAKCSFDDGMQIIGENTSIKPLYTVKKTRFTVFSQNREKARNVDRISRVIFPTVFILFNIIYWLIYIFWQPDKNDLVQY